MKEEHNIEFKAYYEDLKKAIKICIDIGATKIRDHHQKDIYYFTNTGKLKLRDDLKYGKQLIYYERANTNKARSCHYTKLDITPIAEDMSELLKNSLGIKAVTQKHRITFQTDYALINIDDFERIGKFVEIEVLVEKAKSVENAYSIAEELKNRLEIQPSDIVAFSYSDLIKMYENAEFWRAKLKAQAHSGKLVLFDGCSCSGKTTLIQKLIQDDSFDIKLIPRYCTRERRENDMAESEYTFVDTSTFNDMVSNGEFIEFRDFEFGMSYGLSWKDSFGPVLDGHNAVGVMDLGNVVHIKKILPEAVTILIKSPIETIRKRLQERGHNTLEQIEERIDNAKTVVSFERFYDYIIDNDDGALDRSVNQLKKIFSKETQKRNS